MNKQDIDNQAEREGLALKTLRNIRPVIHNRKSNCKCNNFGHVPKIITDRHWTLAARRTKRRNNGYTSRNI